MLNLEFMNPTQFLALLPGWGINMLIERLTAAIIEMTHPTKAPDRALVIEILEAALADALKRDEAQRQLKKAFLRTAMVQG